MLRHLCDAYQRFRCDGLFLSDITYLGIELPVEEVLSALTRFHPSFVVVDGAQSLHQRTVDLSRLPCDLYLAGTQKWFGAYHPLRLAYIGRRTNEASIEQTVRDLSSDGAHPDALFNFCHAVEQGDFASLGETVNISSLIAAAGALRQAHWEASLRHDQWHTVLKNARSLADWLGGESFRPLRPHESLGSGILLLSAKRPKAHSATRVRTTLARYGIIASAFPKGILRLSMPRHYLSLHQKSRVSRALHRSLVNPKRRAISGSDGCPRLRR